MLVDAPRFKYLPDLSNLTSIRYSTPITEGHYAGGSKGGLVDCKSPGVDPSFCQLQKGLAKLAQVGSIGQNSFTSEDIKNAFLGFSVSVAPLMVQIYGENEQLDWTDAIEVSCKLPERDVMQQLSIKQGGTTYSIFGKGRVIFACIDAEKK